MPSMVMQSKFLEELLCACANFAKFPSLENQKGLKKAFLDSYLHLKISACLL